MTHSPNPTGDIDIKLLYKKVSKLVGIFEGAGLWIGLGFKVILG
jgi:hypothetical protein